MITIGIDFGTTKTLVACPGKNGGEPFLAQIGRGIPLIPTTIYLNGDGRVCIGEDADDMAKLEPQNYCGRFKMGLGSTRRLLQKKTAKELTGLFLKEVLRRVRQLVYMDEEDSFSVVITRPVSFSPLQIEELESAAKEAGFADVCTLTEPEAAGRALCALAPDKAFREKALIVDWGGGTLDLALVTRTEDGIRSYPGQTRGLTDIGGDFFDAQLWQDARQQLCERGKNDGFSDVRTITEQMRTVRKAKELLSSVEEYPLVLSGTEGIVCLPMTRQRIKTLIAPALEKALETITAMLKEAEQNNGESCPILLVGGCSHIPYIGETLEKRLKCPVSVWHKGREAVALGTVVETTVSTLSEEQKLVNRGKTLIDKERDQKSYHEAAQCFRQAAEKNNVEAQYLLAECYYKGIGVRQSTRQAHRWYRKAATNGHIPSLIIMGIWRRNPNRLYPGFDDNNAFSNEAKWLRQAADREDTVAEREYGYRLYKFCGWQCTNNYDPREKEEGTRYLQNAANKGDKLAALLIEHQEVFTPHAGKRFEKKVKIFLQAMHKLEKFASPMEQELIDDILQKWENEYDMIKSTMKFIILFWISMLALGLFVLIGSIIVDSPFLNVITLLFVLAPLVAYSEEKEKGHI